MGPINPLTPDDHYWGRTTTLTSKRCILYIYSTNIGIEYFKHGIYSPLLSLQNAVCFIILTYLVPVLFTFYIQCGAKIKKKNSGAKRLNGDYKGRQISPITGPRYPEGSRKLRFPDYVTVAQDGAKVVSLTHRPLFYAKEILLVLISVRR